MKKRGQAELALMLLLAIGLLVLFASTTVPVAQENSILLSPGEGGATGIDLGVWIALAIIILIFVAMIAYLIMKYFVPKWAKEKVRKVAADSVDQLYVEITNAENALEMGRVGDAEKFYARMQSIYLSLDDRERKRAFPKAEKLYQKLAKARGF